MAGSEARAQRRAEVYVRRTAARRLVLFGAGVVALAAVLASCSSGGGGAKPSNASPTRAATLAVAPTAVSEAPARPSAGCNGTAALMPGASTQEISVGGIERTYRRYLPDDGQEGPRPLVINLHGLSSNADQQAVLSAFEPLAAQEHFIVLTPQGEGKPAGWSITATASNPDIVFIKAMLDEAEATACVDTARVYSTGLSNGGIMSALLACEMSDRIAAVGLVSGIVHPAGCRPSRPVPMMVFWGEKDVVLPFCGGVGPIVAALIAGRPLDATAAPTCPPANSNGFPPVEDVVGDWAASDGCGSTPAVLQAGSDVEERIFTGCGGDASIRFFVVSDGGHTWPGSKVMEALSASPAASIIGHTTDEVDATRLIWAFFRGYALASPP